ncbi:glycosyltransferase family 4 protein [Leucobacter insecticola]|uniref:Glycosyltransferase family 4 protein n=1 Tax=Leucobacter insecticola TaxID=2714934 RepID=A0A6G8FHP0_9MICO|nr:glycosyltransferase family 4 protein [Leucobacter insecticola]QIM15885.1 glycosyltransferase family 4 protein [Leucobacter insecticola]
MPAAELRAQLAGATASLATLLPGGGYDYAFTSKVYSSLAVGCPVIFSGPGPTRSFVETANAQVAAGFAVGYDAPEIAAAMSNLVAQAPSAEDRRAVAEWTEAEHSLRAVANRVTRVMGSVAKTRRAKR